MKHQDVNPRNEKKKTFQRSQRLCGERMQILVAFQRKFCTTNWFVSILTHRTTCKKKQTNKESDKNLSGIWKVLSCNARIFLSRSKWFTSWIGEFYLQITLLCGTYDTQQTHDFHNKNQPKKKTSTQIRSADGIFRVGSCLITAHEMWNKNTTAQRKKQSSRKSISIAFNLCKLKWEETEQSSGKHYFTYFERLTICIFLLKIFDYVTVENTLKAALSRLLQFIMFRPINSTICKNILSDSNSGAKQAMNERNKKAHKNTKRATKFQRHEMHSVDALRRERVQQQFVFFFFEIREWARVQNIPYLKVSVG